MAYIRVPITLPQQLCPYCRVPFDTFRYKTSTGADVNWTYGTTFPIAPPTGAPSTEASGFFSVTVTHGSGASDCPLLNKKLTINMPTTTITY